MFARGWVSDQKTVSDRWWDIMLGLRISASGTRVPKKAIIRNNIVLDILDFSGAPLMYFIVIMQTICYNGHILGVVGVFLGGRNVRAFDLWLADFWQLRCAVLYLQ
jgi:hypothetical protein